MNAEARHDAARDRGPVSASPQGPSGEEPVPFVVCFDYRRAITVTFSMLVLAASVWYIGRTFRWKEIGHALQNVNLTVLVLGGGASIVLYWMLRTLRWHILLQRTNTSVPLLDLYLCTAVSLSFALFTPLQSGEMLKIELLKRYGMISRSPGYGSFLVERALDLTTVLAMACLSLLTTLNILPNRAYAYYFISGLAIVCIAGLLILRKLRLKGPAQQMLDHMRECVRDVSTFLLVTVITCASWASVAFSWQIFLDSASVHLSFSQSIAMMSVVALISILSLIPGGLAITEAGSSEVLLRFGFVPAMAQAGALVLRSYSVIAIVLGALHLGLWKVVRMQRGSRRRDVPPRDQLA